jgi:dolichyl-phosphate beta-glucosyltransferase
MIKESQELESISTVHSSPSLSIVVPVYNGSKKIGPALEKLKTQIVKLEATVRRLEALSSIREKRVVNTGRRIIENASAAVLLDNYLSATRSSDNNEESGFDLSRFGSSSNNDNSAESLLQNSWYEFIIVNDGSKDNTREVVRRLSQADKTIRLISYSTNMGKGYAIRQGVLHSRGKYIIFIDGDGEINAEILSNYLENLNSADIVIASKYHPNSVVRVPSSRRFFSKCFQLFVKVILGVKVSDTQVGLKVGYGDAFRKIFGRVIVERYAFDAEMLAVASIMGLRIVEMPVKIELDKSFKKKEIVRMALDVLGVAYRLRMVKWYQKNMEKQRPSYRAVLS